ncbi:transglutaminase-like domain-containing protein [Thermodesulfobacteriota bacterium]
MDKIEKKHLLPTSIIDSDNKQVIKFAKDTIGDGIKDPIEMAVKLYYAVRDGIWYDPYYPFYLPEHYRASNVLKSGRGYCVCKASLLCAIGRSCGIPTRIGFADVRNHLATKQLIEFMGCDLFVYHGFTEFYLEGKWVKSTPAFNIELCQKHNVAPLEFNGREDSLFHPYNKDEQLFMEYVTYHGIYADIPVDIIVEAWKKAYGEDRVSHWIDEFEKQGGTSNRNFDKEDVIDSNKSHK